MAAIETRPQSFQAELEATGKIYGLLEIFNEAQQARIIKLVRERQAEDNGEKNARRPIAKEATA